MTKSYLLVGLALAVGACNTTQKTASTPKPPVIKKAEPIVEKEIDEIIVTADSLKKSKKNQDYTLPIYNASQTRKVDLLHTKLDVRFDWAKQHLLGKAAIKMKPWFYPQSEVVLDAKNFDIKSVTFEGKKEPLKYTYNNEQITIQLGKTFTRNDDFTLAIEYVAKPNERKTIGGSEAITSDKGLFFINPLGEESDKPMQIWTQGETENNSRWFPTFDKPNERMTNEIYMTVEDKYKTLSNGVLASSKKNADGTRTDYWKMEQSHAPYLVMMAVGDFAVVKDKWNGMEVNYYVEPKFEKDAKAIFPNTTEMLGFFSDKLGVKYPWQKYSQIIVRDYVSGAMENTTAVIFGDFMQKTTRELKDDEGGTNEKVVAHEMFHHWFGDYVTCESWSNLTLNEGFANYSEYLWLEHKYGKEFADNHRLDEVNGYMGSARQNAHSLINFGYKDKEDMFDAHSYNKGGAILHMLRSHVGDEAFFTALKNYLTKNAYTSVEAPQLRMAMEDITGEDLNWFFNQWFNNQGHPVLDINYGYDAATKKASVTIEQLQDPEKNPAIFVIPMAIDIYDANGKKTREMVRMTKRKETFTFDAATKPALINTDANKSLLSEKNDHHTDEEWAFMYKNAGNYIDRTEALSALKEGKSPAADKIFKAALDDKSWTIRKDALNLNDAKDATIAQKIAVMAEKDARPAVRAAAIDALASTEDKAHLPIIKKAIEADQSYSVISSALQAINTLDPKAAANYVAKLENEESGDIINAVGEIYFANPDKKYLAFFEKNWNKVEGYSALSFMAKYLALAAKYDDATDASITKLKEVAVNQSQNPWRRFGAAKAIADYSKTIKANMDKVPSEKKEAMTARLKTMGDYLTDIKAKETNAQLKKLYESFDKP
jgi:aminopeptidase N